MFGDYICCVFYLFPGKLVSNSITKLHVGTCVCENIILGVDGE